VPTLREAIEVLNDAVDARAQSFAHGVSVEIRRVRDDEIVLSGNKNGLVWLALHCLELAASANRGSHIHLDQSSTSVCDMPLVIQYWPSEGHHWTESRPQV
jgi:hypothetical protein